MTENKNKSATGRAVVRWLFAVAFIAAVALSGLFSGLMNKAGLFYLISGSLAAALMGFTTREIATAFRQAAGGGGTGESLRRSAHFWEAAARNAWILSALGSALNFTIALGRESGGIAAISDRMIQSLIVILYGLVLAVVCLVPAMKLADKCRAIPIQSEGQALPEADGSARLAFGTVTPDRIIGYVLFAAVLVLTVIFLVKGQPQVGPFPMGRLLLHGPSVLVVLGGAIALALFTGAEAGARSLTLGFAVTGLFALLTGLIQALLGFVHTNIAEISTAVAFIISASMLSLLGLVAVAAPLEDREVMDGRREGAGPFSRMFWVLLPLLTFVFLLLTFIIVITPMTKPGG